MPCDDDLSASAQHTEKWTLELTAEMDKWLGVLVRHQADKVRRIQSDGDEKYGSQWAPHTGAG